mgnify:CR=1 FL=1
MCLREPTMWPHCLVYEKGMLGFYWIVGLEELGWSSLASIIVIFFISFCSHVLSYFVCCKIFTHCSLLSSRMSSWLSALLRSHHLELLH